MSDLGESPTQPRDELYLNLKGARERLCRAQGLLPRDPAWEGQRTALGAAITHIDRVGVFLPQWSKYDEPTLEGDDE